MKKVLYYWVNANPNLKKLIMKLKIAVLLITVGVSNLLANPTYSQIARLNLDMENKSLEQVMDEIERQSEFYFIFNQKQIDVDRIVSIQSDNKLITSVLPELFKGTNVNYAVLDRKILLTTDPIEENLISPAVQDEQIPKRISGTVTDKNGAPLPGVNVYVTGTNQGTTTDLDGKYSFEIPDNARSLTFSFVGMESQTVDIGTMTVINMTMVESSIGMEEVVVVGYGVQKRANLTGAVGQVTSKVLENRYMTNAGQGLQGTVPNLNIVTNPGDPGKIGQGASYQIRGQGSLSGGAPLVLIDGVQGDLNQLNPNDIESISVLKDAASAAIYGARATYGVMLVTTKKGSARKTVVSVNSSVSSSSITKFPNVVNSLKYAEVMNEASRNAGIADYFPPEQLERIRKFIENPGSIPTTIPDPTDPSKWSYASGNDNINYQRIYYKNQMFSNKDDIAISGGSGSTDYRFSLGYLTQDGVYAFGGDIYNRYNILGNVNTQLNKWLKFKFQTMYNKGVTDEPYAYAGLMGNYFHTAFTRQPHWAFYDPNGNPMWTSQKQFFEGARQNTKMDEMKLVGEMIIEPVTGWKVNARYSWDQNIENGVAHEAKLYAWTVDNKPYTLQPNNSVTKTNSTRNYNSFEVFSSYDKQFGKHTIAVLAGWQLENYYASTLGGYVPYLITDEIPSLNTGTGKKNTWDAIDEWVDMGYFGRVNYNYMEKYLFEANLRYDGTSKFPSGRRWGLFPSVSAGWNIAKEKFFSVEQISTLKLRASYGSLGNQQVGNYLFFSKVPINANLGWILGGDRPYYIGAPGLVSNNLTWETANTIDFGLDVLALKDRLDFSFDWYTRQTIGMIGPANALPSVLGVTVPKTNNADMVTRGFETSIGWRDRVNNDFQYNISFNLADYITKITKYNNPNKLLSTYYEGMTLGEIWGYETVGIIQTDEQLANMADQKKYINSNLWKKGDIEYKDLNGDGVISPGKGTLDDPGDRKVIGNNTPRFAFGAILGASWKGFDFNMFWQGILKRDMWLADIPFFGITGSWTQQVYETTTDYWTPENTDAYFSRPYATGEIRKNQQVQTRYLQNASYGRLKNIQIGYTLPQSILKAAKIQKIRIYLNGENLLTFSPIDDNFDPERVTGSWGPGKTYPLFRTVTAGINVEF